MSKLKDLFPVPFREVYTNRFILVVVLLAIVDLATKYWATQTLRFCRHLDCQSTSVIGDLLQWTLVANTGAIFGSFRGNLIPSTIIMFIAMTILVVLYWRENKNLGTPTGWMLVMGGALGNFIDKLFVKRSLDAIDKGAEPGWSLGMQNEPATRGWVGVVDFIDVDFPDIFHEWWSVIPPRWYTFNVADMYIFFGVTVLIISMIRMSREEARQAAEEKTGQ